MVGKGKPLVKVNKSGQLVVDTNVIVKQEHELISPQSASSNSDHEAIIKHEIGGITETTSSNIDKSDG